MKKIDFGINEDARLNSSFSGVSPYNGEYLGVINYKSINLLITRIVDSQKGLNGNIDVREIAQDYYCDGSSVTYSNMDKNSVCTELERLLNTERVKKMLSEKGNVLMVLQDLGLPVRPSVLHSIEPKYEDVGTPVTGISGEKFQDLKDTMGMMRASMYNICKELMAKNKSR